VLDAVEARLEIEVVLEVSEVAHVRDLRALGVQPARPAAGREQQVAELDHLAALVPEPAALGVHLDDLVAQAHVHLLLRVPLVGMERQAVERRGAEQQLLGEQGPAVRPMVLAREHQDVAGLVARANALDGGGGGVTSTDDAVADFHATPHLGSCVRV